MKNETKQTAEEFLKECQSNPHKGWSTRKAMIEFAKLHVEKALKVAFEDVPCGSSSDISSAEEIYEVIFNSYSLENIK